MHVSKNTCAANPTDGKGSDAATGTSGCRYRTRWTCAMLLVGLAATSLYFLVQRDAYVVISSQVPSGAAVELGGHTPASRPAPIAMLVMLPNDPLQWAQVLGAMASNADIDAYFFMWRSAPTAETIAAAVDASRGALKRVWHEPGTVWSSGRNALARAAYAAEMSRGVKYRYWVFFDEEILGCAGCDDQPTRAPSCCMDYMIRDVLLGPYNFAMLGQHNGPRTSNREPFSEAQMRTFDMHDCPDAKMAAIHRDAAPVLLPYIPDLDRTAGWWSSQVFIFHFASACVPGGSAMMSRVFRDLTPSHKEYPKGSANDAAFVEFFRAHFPSLTSGGFLINSTKSLTTCARNGKTYYPGRDTVYPAWSLPARVGEPGGDEQTAAIRAAWGKAGLPVVEWKELPSYRQCLGVLGPRFDAVFGLAPGAP